MSNIYIATAEYNGDFFKDKEILSLDKSAQTQVKTTNQIQLPDFDFELFYANKPVFYSSIAIALIFFILIIKLIFKPKKKKVKSKGKIKEAVKTKKETATAVERKEQKVKLNYSTPNNLNSCIRMFLERTKHK